MRYYKTIVNGYIVSVGIGYGFTEISKDEYDAIASMVAPKADSGYTYRLRADNLEWELVKLPPVEPEPLTDEESLTRYANELTGASDQTLIEAAETLIAEKIKEE